MQATQPSRFLLTTSPAAFEGVEKACKAAPVNNEAAKDSFNKKSAGKGPRREEALFDINPRAAREFLLRAQNERIQPGVSFQSEREQFTQWREEEERAARAQPHSAPTSFAQALLKKLNINDEADTNGVKGESIANQFGGMMSDGFSSIQTKTSCAFSRNQASLEIAQNPHHLREGGSRGPKVTFQLLALAYLRI
jgi:hypothetical protein